MNPDATKPPTLIDLLNLRRDMHGVMLEYNAMIDGASGTRHHELRLAAIANHVAAQVGAAQVSAVTGLLQQVAKQNELLTNIARSLAAVAVELPKLTEQSINNNTNMVDLIEQVDRAASAWEK